MSLAFEYCANNTLDFIWMFFLYCIACDRTTKIDFACVITEKRHHFRNEKRLDSNKFQWFVPLMRSKSNIRSADHINVQFCMEKADTKWKNANQME